MNARIEKYLKAYNLIQLTGWLMAIISLPFSFLVSLYTICFFQILSAVEIFHAWKKWNNSSPLFCFLQIGARLFILIFTILIIGATVLKPVPFFESIVYIMFIAWSLAEIIRYAYYSTLLFKKANKQITWLRYSAFIICYPVGLACEFFIMFNVFKYYDTLAIKVLMVIIAIAYLFLFPKLFKHLLQQRKQKLIHLSKY